MKTKVYAKNVLNLTDARYFAAWMVEGIIFDFGSEEMRKQNLPNYLLMKEWIAGPKMIGFFEKEMEVELLFEYYSKLELDSLLLEKEELGFEASGLEHHQLVKLDSNENVVNKSVLLLVDDYFHNLNNETQLFITKMCLNNSVILDIPINLEGLPALIETAKPSGLVLAGSEEEKVGFKSYDDLDEIFEWLED